MSETQAIQPHVMKQVPLRREGIAPVCWVVIDVSHYHSARMAAFARRTQMRSELVELTNKDSFVALEHAKSPDDSYGRLTLFPGRQYRELSSAAIRQAVRKWFSTLKPAVVCVNGWRLRGSIEVLGQCLDSGIPTVLMSESTAYDCPRTKLKESIKSQVVRLCSAALVGGRPHVDYIVALGMPRDRTFVGYDVVDNEHFSQGADKAREVETVLRQRLMLPKHYFLSSARFEKKKNLFRLLRAYAAYRAMAGRNHWKLVVLGDGILRPQLLELRSQLGLVEDAMFPGFKGYDELPNYYGLASAFVHASTSEQWGLVVNEAMASGLPVLVSARCGCAPDLLDEGKNGWTFDPLDVEPLAELMLRISRMTPEETLAMGRASQEIIARWTPETFADGLLHAVEAATTAPRPHTTSLDRALLWFLTHR